ncbi:nucleoside-diphosphate sugar epimerase [Agromyces luteolus]|uniref:NAD(P)H-binding protein n=1 Tax=Agromyces luteolus TaxID=88373 RepID=A0A7C9LU47_9MICO|nr:SDR family oxidoreductase [Agromyces luteolus]MUN08156.1 NAD(P)H-binding protein [Agromyces luteolus]GLK29622.1 nucleoside-diphosphate sugar epimerase [Agromyces luteolus]
MRIAIAGATGVVGRHVVRAAEARGHDILALTRSAGHDLERGSGPGGTSLAAALDGVDAVIDVTSVQTTSTTRSRAFFTAVTEHLLAAERDAGVGHHVALSIVGIDGVDASYFAGKHAQERLVEAGPVPYTILRATQFHEFAEQVSARLSLGRLLTPIPVGRYRPVAAREVGARLVELAEAGPAGRARDLTGPREERLVEMVRRMFAHDGVRRPVIEFTLPGAYFRASASGMLRGNADALRGATTFDEWLRSADHTSVGAQTDAAASVDATAPPQRGGRTAER